MAKTESEKDMMNRLYQEYGLSSDDIFAHKHYKIITRAGIDKIQARSGIIITYDVVHIQRHQGGLDVAIKATGTMTKSDGSVEKIETFGEASPENTTQNYPFAMAEKRAMARAVLKLAGLYAENFFSEDEADEFGKIVRGNQPSTVKYKGSN